MGRPAPIYWFTAKDRQTYRFLAPANHRHGAVAVRNRQRNTLEAMPRRLDLISPTKYRGWPASVAASCTTRGTSRSLRQITEILARYPQPTRCSRKSVSIKKAWLVTGPTGSGKSTTLAAMIDYINDHFDKHIAQSDPIEFVREETQRHRAPRSRRTQ